MGGLTRLMETLQTLQADLDKQVAGFRRPFDGELRPDGVQRAVAAILGIEAVRVRVYTSPERTQVIVDGALDRMHAALPFVRRALINNLTAGTDVTVEGTR